MTSNGSNFKSKTVTYLKLLHPLSLLCISYFIACVHNHLTILLTSYGTSINRLSNRCSKETCALVVLTQNKAAVTTASSTDNSASRPMFRHYRCPVIGCITIKSNQTKTGRSYIENVSACGFTEDRYFCIHLCQYTWLTCTGTVE